MVTVMGSTIVDRLVGAVCAPLPVKL